MKFRTTLLAAGKTATGIQVPDEVVTSLGSSKRPAVRATVNGHTYRSTVAVMGGVFMLPVSAEHRSKAGIAAGDEVDVDLELDTEPRVVAVPDDLAEALAGDDKARMFFDSLSPSQKGGYVTWIEQAKQEATRTKRIADALVKLRDGRKNR